MNSIFLADAFWIEPTSIAYLALQGKSVQLVLKHNTVIQNLSFPSEEDARQKFREITKVLSELP